MSALVYATCQVLPDTYVECLPGRGARIGAIGHDLHIVGEPADLTRLADVLYAAAATTPQGEPA